MVCINFHSSRTTGLIDKRTKVRKKLNEKIREKLILANEKKIQCKLFICVVFMTKIVQ